MARAAAKSGKSSGKPSGKSKGATVEEAAPPLRAWVRQGGEKWISADEKTPVWFPSEAALNEALKDSNAKTHVLSVVQRNGRWSAAVCKGTPFDILSDLTEGLPLQFWEWSRLRSRRGYFLRNIEAAEEIVREAIEDEQGRQDARMTLAELKKKLAEKKPIYRLPMPAIRAMIAEHIPGATVTGDGILVNGIDVPVQEYTTKYGALIQVENIRWHPEHLTDAGIARTIKRIATQRATQRLSAT